MPDVFYTGVDPSVILRPAGKTLIKDSYLVPVKVALGAERFDKSLVTALFDTYCFKLPYNGEAPTVTHNTVIK